MLHIVEEHIVVVLDPAWRVIGWMKCARIDVNEQQASKNQDVLLLAELEEIGGRSWTLIDKQVHHHVPFASLQQDCHLLFV